jgi:hypothetical protein
VREQPARAAARAAPHRAGTLGARVVGEVAGEVLDGSRVRANRCSNLD